MPDEAIQSAWADANCLIARRPPLRGRLNNDALGAGGTVNYWCYAACALFAVSCARMLSSCGVEKNSAARRFLRAAARLSTECEGGIMQRREPFFIPYNFKLYGKRSGATARL